MVKLLTGQPVVAKLNSALEERVSHLSAAGIKPCLAIIRLGENEDDMAYERVASKRAAKLGVAIKPYHFSRDLSEQELLDTISQINADPTIHGLLIFRPLPKHIDDRLICAAINPLKDIDCINDYNFAQIFSGSSKGYLPCTPEACLELLNYYDIEIRGKNVVVVGCSLVVGKPLALLLLEHDATVDICHYYTHNLKEHCQRADIVFFATGNAKLAKADFFRPGQIVIDIGINIDENGKLCGDIDFDEVSKKVQAITPVPGGIGTITSSILLKHTIKAAEMEANNLA